MATSSTVSHPEEQHFLRAEAELTTEPHPSVENTETTVANDPADTWWPLPEDLEKVSDTMQQCAGFSLLAIRIDPPDAGKKGGNLRAGIEKWLEEAVEPNAGCWFFWKEDGYGLIMPDIDAEAGKFLAHNLQKELAGTHVKTVSIGITEYPSHTFDHRQTLRNGLKALDHAVFFGPDSTVVFDSVSLNISGDVYYQAGDLKRAVEEYRIALALDGSNTNARNSLGVCLAQLKQEDAARQEFETVCRTHPEDAMALFNMGLIDLNNALPDQAMTFFHKAYDADPKTFDIPYQIGRLYADQQQPETALTYLEAAKGIRDDYGPLYAVLGQCLARLEQIQPAVAAYKKAVKCNPNDAETLSELGILYAKKGENLDICLTFCRQSVLIAPQNSLYRYRLADLYHQFKKWDAALVEYERAAELGYDVGDRIDQVRTFMATSNEPDEDLGVDDDIQVDEGIRCA